MVGTIEYDNVEVHRPYITEYQYGEGTFNEQMNQAMLKFVGN